MTDTSTPTTFAELGLAAPLLEALAAVGYEAPSPIQAATIPAVLEGRDVLGQAQTGTGKTAAFALPLLSRLDLSRRQPQVLVLVPTRELAIQVAEAFQKYAAKMDGFHVLPIYGGQSYTPQLNALRRGTHVLVGTPGRVMDHLERGTLDLSTVRHVVLDEADEMLQMGFVDAIDTILARVPAERQVVLYSATMAPAIRRIAEAQMRDPVRITIRAATTTAANIRQRYWLVSGMHKLDALTRMLEVEPFEAMLIFARTKQATVELAEKLEARGFPAAALNGDVPQAQRERTVAALKSGLVDIVVATDVAARGLDVERVSHVVNFDVPYDSEAYVHRIGRTGRAGRSGEAILFIAPRERNMLRVIERATRQPIEAMTAPSVDDVHRARLDRLRGRVTHALSEGGLEDFRAFIEDFVHSTAADPFDVAAALARLAQGKTALRLARPGTATTEEGDARPAPAAASVEVETDGPTDGPPPSRIDALKRKMRAPRHEAPQATYRLQVGRIHGVLPGHIVGLLAHEADLAGHEINGVDIQHDVTYVRLPDGMPPELLARLAGHKLRGVRIGIERLAAGDLPQQGPRAARPRPPKFGGKPPRRGPPRR